MFQINYKTKILKLQLNLISDGHSDSHVDWSRLPEHVINDFEIWCRQHRSQPQRVKEKSSRKKKSKRRDRSKSKDKVKIVVNDENRNFQVNAWTPLRFSTIKS